jgi:hypothetical protein
MRTNVAHRAVSSEPRPASARDLEIFQALCALGRESVESQLRGPSMGRTIPDGSRIRIANGVDWQAGDVIAFLAGSRIMVHRVVHVGRRGAAREFIITQGDGNWLCDPPVHRRFVAGVVREWHDGVAWKPVGPGRSSMGRRLVATPLFVLSRAALEAHPAVAAPLARTLSYLRMGLRAVGRKIVEASHVRD